MKSAREISALQLLAFGALFAGLTSLAPGSPARADSPTQCYTAVYDQQTTGTYAHYGKGTWDATRSICIHVSGWTTSFLGTIQATTAAVSNPYIHVMYVIDRTQSLFYAPCGANVVSDAVPGGVLSPGTYNMTNFSLISPAVPNLGAGAQCNITI